MGDLRKKPSDEDIPEDWDSSAAIKYKNGWGAVVMLPVHQSQILATHSASASGDQDRAEPTHVVFYMLGEVPPAVLTRFCSRKACIYFLEAWAQILCAFLFAPHLTTEYHALIDNEAAKFALIKGYGKDTATNSIISMYWNMHAQQMRPPWVDRVSSKCNAADEVSRGDTTAAIRRGWIRLDPDLSEVYSCINQATSDMQFATGPAATRMYSSLQCQRSATQIFNAVEKARTMHRSSHAASASDERP